MKKIIKTLSAGIIMFLLLNGCEAGMVGPQGPEGPPGPDILPTSFEFEANLTHANGFEYFRDIPGQIDMLNSDVILVYILEDVDNGLEVWRKLPLTEFNSRGTLLFDFDFTLADVRVFLDANYSLGLADEFRGLLMRAVHIPANYLNMNKMQSAKSAETFEELEVILGVEVFEYN